MAELDDVFKTWQGDQTPDAAASLLRTAKPVLDKAITTYAGRAGPILSSKAKMLAMGAFRSYDPKRGTKLRTHLMTRLQPLRREAIRSGQVIRTPERVTYDRRALNDAKDDYAATYGKPPSDHELADLTGLSLSRIGQVRGARRAVSPSQLGGFEPPAEGAGPGDMWMEYVYHDLHPTDKKILDWRLGRHGTTKLSNNEIAIKLKMSPAAISQRTAKILARLQEGEELDV